jgi:hypothetical protein
MTLLLFKRLYHMKYEFYPYIAQSTWYRCEHSENFAVFLHLFTLPEFTSSLQFTCQALLLASFFPIVFVSFYGTGLSFSLCANLCLNTWGCPFFSSSQFSRFSLSCLYLTFRRWCSVCSILYVDVTDFLKLLLISLLSSIVALKFFPTSKPTFRNLNRIFKKILHNSSSHWQHRLEQLQCSTLFRRVCQIARSGY